MASYRDDYDSGIEELFSKLKTDPFASPISDPTPFEIAPIGAIQPVGWVANADATDGTATVTIDSNGITILNGRITLEDYSGRSVLGPAGFDGSWIDFIARGVYNGSFSVGALSSGLTAETIVGTAGTAADYKASLSQDIPSWIIDSVTGTATYGLESDAAVAPGNTMTVRKSAAGVGEFSMFQDVPVAPGGLRQDFVILGQREQAEASKVALAIYVTELDADHGVVVAESLWDNIVATNQTGFRDVYYSDGLPVSDASVRYLRVRLVVTFAATAALHDCAAYFSVIVMDPGNPIAGLVLVGKPDAIGGNTLHQFAVNGDDNHLQIFMDDGPLELLRTTNDVALLEIHRSGEDEPRLTLRNDAKIEFGDGTNAPDTNLFRTAADVLRTNDAFSSMRAAGTDLALQAVITGDTAGRLNIFASGDMVFSGGTGATADVTLSRSAANTLALGTGDQLNLGGTLIISISATSTNGSGQNNYNPTGLGTTFNLNWNPSGSFAVTGFVAQTVGTMFLIVNHHASNTITLRNENASSTDVNRIRCPGNADMIIPGYGTALLVYVSSRWRVLFGS